MSTQSVPLNEADLEQLYAPPSERIQKAVLSELISCHVAYLEKATFFCLATGNESGLDASPRGGPAGFVKVLDNKTVAFADWPGNNRIESMRNLTSSDKVGMLFLFPGLEVFMRINGRAYVTDDEVLCTKFTQGGKVSKTAIIVTVDEVLFHCGRAINRARLWEPESKIERKSLPTPGQVLAEITRQQASVAEAIDVQYEQSVRNDLYG